MGKFGDTLALAQTALEQEVTLLQQAIADGTPGELESRRLERAVRSCIALQKEVERARLEAVASLENLSDRDLIRMLVENETFRTLLGEALCPTPAPPPSSSP